MYVKLLFLLICLIGCSNEVNTENKQLFIDNIHKERIGELCPSPGLVGGEEIGPNYKYVRVHQCSLNDKGWIDHIDFYSYEHCNAPFCINAKLYYTYYEYSYKTCHWSWDEYDYVYIISKPCNTYIFEF